MTSHKDQDSNSESEAESLDDYKLGRQPYTSPNIVQWTNDPGKDLRIMDWIDCHPMEREVLFQPLHGKHGGSTKKDVYLAMTEHFFSFEDSRFQNELASKVGKERLRLIIQVRLSRYKRKYNEIIDHIGPASASQEYEKMSTIARQKLDKLFQSFPIWPRLHVYWRTNPTFNRYIINDCSSPEALLIRSSDQDTTDLLRQESARQCHKNNTDLSAWRQNISSGKGPINLRNLIDSPGSHQHGASQNQEPVSKGKRKTAPRRVRDINLVDWHHDPSKDMRLMDWIDSHPRERKILFAGAGGPVAKCEIYRQIAKDFFSFENIRFREELHSKSGLGRLRSVISTRIKDYKKKYKRILDCIGAPGARYKYEDIRTDSDTYNILEEKLKAFPIWKRLHEYWMDLPQYNHYHIDHYPLSESSPSPSAPGSPVPFGQRRIINTRQLAQDTAKFQLIEPHFSQEKLRSPSEDSDTIIMTGYNMKQDIQESLPGNTTIASITSGKRKRNETEDAWHLSPDDANNPNDNLKIVQIQLKKARVELEIQEKKTASEIRRMEIEAQERRQALEDERELMREKNQLLARCMYLIAGGTSVKERTPPQSGHNFTSSRK